MNLSFHFIGNESRLYSCISGSVSAVEEAMSPSAGSSVSFIHQIRTCVRVCVCVCVRVSVCVLNEHTAHMKSN